MKRVLLCSLALLLVNSAALADGILKQVNGTVTINEKAGRIGDIVPSGAMIQTGTQSRADIQFDDGHIIALGSTSQLLVQEYVYSKNEPAKDSMLFNFFKGTLRSISGALGARNPTKFSLTTPTATAGIRGTDFLSSIVDYVGQDGITRKQVFFSVQRGQILVTTKAGSLFVNQSQSVLTTPSGAITPISPPQLPVDLQSMAVTDTGLSGAGGVQATQAASGGAVVTTGVGAATAVVGAAVIMSTETKSTAGSTTGSHAQ